METFDAVFLAGRVLFATLFIFSGLGHFMQMGDMSRYAESKGVPAPSLLIGVTGLMILAGGLSILLWKEVVIGAGLLVVFLLLAAFKVHDFWAQEDPIVKQGEMAQFMKNVALAGASLIFYALAQNPGVVG